MSRDRDNMARSEIDADGNIGFYIVDRMGICINKPDDNDPEPTIMLFMERDGVRWGCEWRTRDEAERLIAAVRERIAVAWPTSNGGVPH